MLNLASTSRKDLSEKKDYMQRFKEKIQKLAPYNFSESIWISGSIPSSLISGF